MFVKLYALSTGGWMTDPLTTCTPLPLADKLNNSHYYHTSDTTLSETKLIDLSLSDSGHHCTSSLT